jgi:hypothetical protein
MAYLIEKHHPARARGRAVVAFVMLPPSSRPTPFSVGIA